MAPGLEALGQLGLAVYLREAQPACPLAPNLMGEAYPVAESLRQGLAEYGRVQEGVGGQHLPRPISTSRPFLAKIELCQKLPQESLRREAQGVVGPPMLRG